MGTNHPTNILVVDDEPKILRLVESYLAREGFHIVTAADGPECLRRFREEAPDLVVLDLGLPKLDGMDVARVIRRESAVPIIMLTARAEEADKLEGLDTGADDYVTKPFSPRELVARVRAVLRRTGRTADALRAGGAPAGGAATGGGALQVQDLVLDPSKRQARQGGKAIELTAYQFDLLAFLLSHADQVLSREQLLDHLHDDDSPFDRTVDAHVKNLRRLLHDDPSNPRYIETVRGIGYRFRGGSPS